MSHVPVADHRAAVAALLGHGSVETVRLDHRVAGRRLATALVAADDLPRFDTSAMDGYAVGPAGTEPRTYAVVADVAAGDVSPVPVRVGEAVRIMTGAPVPEGALAVVPVECTDAARTGPAPARVTVTTDVVPGRHVRRRGEDVVSGRVVGSPGDVVSPSLLALALSAGCTTAQVHRPTRVAVVATGAELTAPGTAPGPGGIHESNSAMVAALADAAGCTVQRVERCDDDPGTLRALLDDLDADPAVDLVVTTGGVSAGAHEVVRQVCEPLGAFRFVHLAMQPGGPQGLGTWGTTPVVCLPGTPTGAFVAFHVLVRPALDARHGAGPAAAARAVWRGPTRRTRIGLTQFVTSVLGDDGTVSAPDASHLSALAQATCLVEVPVGVDELVEGDEVTVHRL